MSSDLVSRRWRGNSLCRNCEPIGIGEVSQVVAPAFVDSFSCHHQLISVDKTPYEK